jgi:hypothetical protein
MAPGDGSEDVAPPSDTEVPPIVMAEFASPAFVSDPVNPSWIFPALGFENVSVKPSVAAEFSKLIVDVDERPFVLVWNVWLEPEGVAQLFVGGLPVEYPSENCPPEHRAG